MHAERHYRLPPSLSVPGIAGGNTEADGCTCSIYKNWDAGLGGGGCLTPPGDWKAKGTAVSTTQKGEVVCLGVQGCLEKQTQALQN